MLVTAKIAGSGTDISLDLQGIVDVCPTCHHAVTAEFRYATLKVENLTVEAVFQCARAACRRLFISEYQATNDRSKPRTSVWKRVYPKTPSPTEFPECISEISSDFIEIHSQAIAAEAHNLNQICGVGLRKALEFLIKDFLIASGKADSETVGKTQLGPCINNFIDDPLLKQCAQKATWLGNDQAHYLARWPEKDLKDLKTLIQLSVNWIHNLHLTEKFAAEMAEGR